MNNVKKATATPIAKRGAALTPAATAAFAAVVVASEATYPVHTGALLGHT